MKHLRNVSLDFVRYANVWEDAAILREGLRIRPGEKVLSIASAGDNCFALLLSDPALVVAADLNPAQLYLIELKMSAIRALDYHELPAFLGFRPAENRLETYRKLAPALSEKARQFWEERPETIQSGVIYDGKFERYFQLFSRRILPLIHSRKTTEALLAPKSAEAQEKFYRERWNTWRWRLLFRIFFSKWVMGKVGRDPAFLKEVEVTVGKHIFLKAEAQLSSVAAQRNFMLRFNLCGDFGDLLPDYLADPGQLELIKTRLDRIQLFQGYAQDAGTAFGPFDAMNLSDIFEYMDEVIFRETAMKLKEISNPGARIGYWNLMVSRRLSRILPEIFEYYPESQDLTRRDRGFYYNQFIVDKCWGSII